MTRGIAHIYQRRRIHLILAGAILFAVMFIPGETIAPTSHTSISITSDQDFTPENGVTGGSGVISDPYVIEGWDIDAVSGYGIWMSDTSAYFVIRNVGAHGSRMADGIHLYNVSNGLVENNMISNNSVSGISIQYSASVLVIGNFIAKSNHCVALLESANITIRDNSLSECYDGIGVVNSDNLTIQNNSFANAGLSLGGRELADFSSHNITSDNLVNGLPILYFSNRDSVILGGISIGQLLVANCTRIGFANLTIANEVTGVSMAFVNTGFIENSYISTHNHGGIVLWNSSKIDIRRNTIFGNSLGIGLYYSANIHASHNSILENLLQVQDGGAGENTWDDGYPSGGNYWSDYSGTDQFGGPNQDQPGADGIGDIPYVIDENSRDSYPLMSPLFDVIPPILSIISPVEGQKIVSTPAWIGGEATDDGGSGVMLVEFRVNNGNWNNATGILSWSASVDLTAGSNAIEARAWDGAGNPSEIVAVNVTYSPRVESSADYKPIIAAVFAAFLVTVGLFSSKRRPWRGRAGKRAISAAFFIISFPFVLTEIVTGVESLFTGMFSIPPLLGIGTTVDLTVLALGCLIAFGRISKK